MPDDDERDDLGELAREALDTETILGWDGDKCQCEECYCSEFLDGDPGPQCRDCRAGHHAGGKER